MLYAPDVMAAFGSINNGFYGDNLSINSDESDRDINLITIILLSDHNLLVLVGTSFNAKDITYKDGRIETATLPVLIQHLIPNANYYPDKNFIFAFILNSRVFVPPYQLFHQVCETCKYQQNLTAEKVHTDTNGLFCQNMIRLLETWAENFPYDFRDERMVLVLKEMGQLLIRHNLLLRRDVNDIFSGLHNRLQALTKYEDLLEKINAEVSNRTNNYLQTVSNTDITETCPDPLILGHQLTHIELERLSMIGPEEFIQDYSVQSPPPHSLKKLTNIDSYVQWYNRLSYFVATEICMHLKKKNRVRMIEYFVDVAKECINIGNFNSLMAIVGGLNMPSIQRLKKTWAKVNREKFEILEHLSNPCGNFNNYRSSLKAALWRSEGASEDRERIVVPFFSVLLKDIYMLNESKTLPDRTSNGHVNFKKMWEITKVVDEFMTWKQIECPFDRSPPVLNYLLTNPVFSENSLTSASYECEPPETNFEKQHFKQLKEQAGL